MTRSDEGRKLAAAGARIVAVIGWRVPTEPIIAAGLTPVTIVPDLSLETPDADRLLSLHESLEARALLQSIVSGDLGFAELILFAPPFTMVSEMLEELRRSDLVASNIPPSYYFELAIQQDESNRVFAAERVAALATRLAAAAGVVGPLPRHALEEAVLATNRVRRAAMKLGRLRCGDRPLPGTNMIKALVAGDVLSPAAHAEVLAALATRAWPCAIGPRFLVVSSSVLGNPVLHSLIEEEGAVVVGEDDLYGACFAPGLISEATGDPLAAIADFYFENPPAQRCSPEATRRRWLYEALRNPEVTDVLIYAQLPIWGWDVPSIRSCAAAHGKRTLTIEQDVRTAEGREAAARSIRTYLEAKNGVVS